MIISFSKHNYMHVPWGRLETGAKGEVTAEGVEG